MLRSCDVLGTSWSTWPRIQLRAAVAMCQFVHGARARWAHRRRYDVKYLVLARAKSCHFIKTFSKQDTKKESISWCYMDRERSLVHKLLLKKTKEMFISIDGYQEKDLRLFGRLFPSALYIGICWEQFFLGLRERRHAPSCNISADHKMISSLNKCKIMSESRNVCSGVACLAHFRVVSSGLPSRFLHLFLLSHPKTCILENRFLRNTTAVLVPARQGQPLTLIFSSTFIGCSTFFLGESFHTSDCHAIH